MGGAEGFAGGGDVALGEEGLFVGECGVVAGSGGEDGVDLGGYDVAGGEGVLDGRGESGEFHEGVVGGCGEGGSGFRGFGGWGGDSGCVDAIGEVEDDAVLREVLVFEFVDVLEVLKVDGLL